ncbi:hypothetical protein ACFLS8_01825 [Chloroflexota bacterium]
MKKLISIIIAVALVVTLALAVVPASAEIPSAKATAQIAELNVMSCSATTGDDVDWDSSGVVTILEQDIKTANQKDLIIDVSLLSALYTDTTVKSKGGTKDTSAAGAAVLAAVFVDDEMVFPGYPIVFEGRVQVLTATLGGYMDDLVLMEEEIGLIIGTLSANSFNFIAPDLSSGVHNVKVKACVVSGAYSQAGSAAAMGVLGLGSVVIEEVRMIQGEDAVPLP